MKKIKCKISDCDRDILYVKQQVCQKHYFRFMRKGYYELEKPKYKLYHSDGYIKVREPQHPLADAQGYMYEHRFVYYEQISKTISECELCSKTITWSTVHIDHIDENRKNNTPENLRATCNGCNTHRGREWDKQGFQLTYKGETKNAGAWAKEPFINVCRNTILRRKKKGMSDYDALFSSKVTHRMR